MFDSFAKALERSWYQPPRWNLLLLPLAWIFAGLTALRRSAFARGYLSTYRAPCTVVVVGNINVGGTGKTPVVIALTRALQEHGLRVGVVSRGYGGSHRGPALAVQHDSDPRLVGDEALLVAVATGAPVFVGSDRPAAVQALLALGELDIVISDDGLQHYALERDFEIVTLDAQRRFGNRHLLPVGPLRESLPRLATVDWVLERGGIDPFSACPLRAVAFESVTDGAREPLDSAAVPKAINALAGIAHPESFFTTLRDLGFEVIPHSFADHHAFCAEDLQPFADQPLVMTQKDAVKCRRFAGSGHWALVVEAELPDGLVPAICKLVAARSGETDSARVDR
jgi:tetraacyldisaccharide 4'-kinase